MGNDKMRTGNKNDKKGGCGSRQDARQKMRNFALKASIW